MSQANVSTDEGVYQNGNNFRIASSWLYTRNPQENNTMYASLTDSSGQCLN
jgi:hypothetical protein